VNVASRTTRIGFWILRRLNVEECSVVTSIKATTQLVDYCPVAIPSVRSLVFAFDDIRHVPDAIGQCRRQIVAPHGRMSRRARLQSTKVQDSKMAQRVLV
jgi:hypothetical protein